MFFETDIWEQDDPFSSDYEDFPFWLNDYDYDYDYDEWVVELVHE